MSPRMMINQAVINEGLIFSTPRGFRSRALMTALFVSWTVPVLADDTQSSNKSQYTIFNPVPDDLMRSFSTDRPTKSSSSTTVDAGHFQYEADIMNWTYDHFNSANTTTSSILVGDPALKMGLTQNTDLEFALAPFNINYTAQRGNSGTVSTKNALFGFGDIYTRVKFNLFGNEGGDLALAVVPYVKAPTAGPSIGNHHWEGGAYAPFTANLPFDITMNITSELDILENTAGDGTHPNYQNMINFGHALFSDQVTGYVEFWSDVNNDTGAPTQYTSDLAVAWLISPNLQLDGGVNLGLNKAVPDVQSYLGISQRF